uniref:Uncharacterized protein n=1 Tax=Oryza brachyantha TaxID=4533 RepID=J3MCI7_ORYBR
MMMCHAIIEARDKVTIHPSSFKEWLYLSTAAQLLQTQLITKRGYDNYTHVLDVYTSLAN